MYKNKNGFTLVELLAVIVVLAIIALIGYSTVGNIITGVQESADKESVREYARSVELAKYEALARGETVTNFTQNWLNDNVQISGSQVECASVKDVNGSIELYGCKVNGSTTRYCYYGEPTVCSTSILTKIYGNSEQNGTPNSDNPVEIQSVGDKTTNLFNIMNISSQLVSSGQITYLDDYSGFIMGSYFANGHPLVTKLAYLCPELKVGDKFIFDFETNAVRNEVPVDYFYLTGYNKSIKAGQEYECTQEMLDSGVYAYAGATENAYIKNIQFQKIETIDKTIEYEPYGKYKIPVKVSGQNINSSKHVLYNERLVTTSTIKVKPNTDYIISVDNYTIAEPKWAIRATNEYRENLTGLESWNLGTQIAGGVNYFNSGEYEYVVLRGWNTNDTYGIDENTQIQIEEGTVATSYEPYVEPITTNIYLDEPLRKVGAAVDYIDFENKLVVRNVGELTNLSSLDWILSTGYFQALLGFNVNVNEKSNSLSNVLQYGDASTDKTFWIDSSGTGIRIINSDIADLNSFKDWISGLDGYVLYPLVSPQTQTIELPELGLNEYYEIETSVLPSDVKYDYDE